MKILTIIGARPQFIKASVVSKTILETDGLEEIIIHTGQHFDGNMSNIFFDQLGIPRPHYQLDINGGSHGDMTGKMLIEIEKILLTEKPDRVMIYGDTNSTLAGALAASKLHIPIAHIEAGLRSFNMHMPEEINRILTDQVSDLLLCPTETAMQNLKNEGFDQKEHVTYHQVGDVMQDSALLFAPSAKKPADLPIDHNFVLATLHRAENTDDLTRLSAIVDALNTIHATIVPVVLPLHPRTKKILSQHHLDLNVHIIEPVGYLEMIWLLQHCSLVLTDSGGVQKEAFFFKKPCVTMRDQTEWIELVEIGANQLVGANREAIIHAVKNNAHKLIEDPEHLYGGGKAADNIVKLLGK
ncbi:non-hydrolyzing UDP-N-acetylglucosamine 2-epimerase [Wohlfahrtiimonas chitiniclastica]|uniref:non-hydrolyzing UDP-N-acetylglucosamine 2-epimerase n=1 Tax=Wohlfahrtiimonas chitiniclastica TaxID=400946 RepID=UPI001BCB2F71|nr:UDP-N-acetylglucosamine 2-epimerase (non-hydrolyzing) [Wohlfahrtiimonas chitiniclastica]MBS7817044.1 UDP-N-acetylglucosamine 2-epimerase (non-hydrolyzing) [Wohlfahrtiimonas chitiniclastica]MBS7822752.1 UDP-N-acetylglucosamine 2-epimerase (non-hydrolyzing) [Wohlfahrtiimonas chitiniclastica]MBS7830567.1 UDP-N-acetylglucosamine 2-epimerase (non-hydrolyzing) [Wohlfahrtiimonas chitiniclastica]MBS7832605.1 UDP-N-acetylglucosamine 2-epimerase (non-hydrolyzing) [Wohlfahrtiimonas chitiniclastica]